MKINCRFCGALIDSSAKICPGCGRVAPAFRGSEKKEMKQFGDSNDTGLTPNAKNTPITASHASVREGRRMETPDENYGKPGGKKDHADFDHVKAAQEQRVPFAHNTSSGKFENRSSASAGVGVAIKIIVLLVIAFIVYSLVRVMQVKKAGYDFELEEGMTLPNSTYSQAFENYFESGKWRFDITGNCVTYKGRNSKGQKFEMEFGKVGQKIAVVELYIDGEMITGTDNIMDNYILGMFMSERGKIDGGTAFRRVGENSGLI
ncbi:MAG: zinc ribbon domain-containing protein [Ruminococcus sp.]|nr:zinc ribbon domain-containing protein [Ruminococcus sp.]